MSEPENTAQKISAEQTRSKQGVTSPQKGQVATLGSNFEILCDKPLPEYDQGDVKAYRAVMHKEAAQYFALVCERHLMPRHKAANVYANIVNSSLVPLVEDGIVFWPPAKQERYVFIYRDVLGRRLLQLGEPPALGLKQDYVLDAVVRHMVTVFQDFRDKDFVHGGIRPTNMYDGGQGKGFERVILGDCLTQPPSSLQPLIYEPIERSMADPLARGQGRLSDDIYAFGVSLAVILRGHDPLQGYSDKEIIQAKLELGSYATITGKDRFKGSVLELLRGLLIDDASQRWSVEDILIWVEGRRLSPKQAIRVNKAPRPIVFENEKHLYASFLAMDLASNPQETMRIVDGSDLEQWIERSLEDAEMLQRYEAMRNEMKGKMRGPAYELEVLCRLSHVLHPPAPVRYKGLSVLGEGAGAALADAMVTKKDVAAYAEMFAAGFLLSWATSQPSDYHDLSTLISRYDRARTYVKQPKIGFGIERCVYLLCPEAHCLSEKLEGYYVRSAEDMILAFEDMCAKGKAHGLFLDRHSAAFLCSRDSKVIEPYLFELHGPEYYKKVLGNIKCLASIQKRMGNRRFPELAQNFVVKLKDVYERYHDRQAREKLKSTIEKYASQGDLVRMASVLDSVEVTTKDLEGFKAAMREYAALSREYQALEVSLQDRDTFGRGTGKEISALISCILAAIAILFITLVFLTKNPVL